MKQLFSILLLLTLWMGMLPAVPVHAAEDSVIINSANFPDSKLRSILSSDYDLDKDGVLSAREIASVTKISGSIYIANTKGIEYFYNLEYFYSSCTSLTEVDFSHNPKLKTLSLQSSSIKELDLSNNPALTSLSVSWIYTLEELDISSCTQLTHLSCGNNKLTQLDVSHLTKLSYLSCDDGQLETLTLGSHPYLTNLEAKNNQLTALNVQGLPALTHLNIAGNHIEALDLSRCTKLMYFTGNTNCLTSLDFTGCTNLQRSFVNGSSYTISLSGDTFDLSTLPGSFRAAKASNWSGGTVSGTILTVDPDAAVVSYQYSCGQGATAVFTLLIAGRTGEPEIEISYANFPDSVLRSWLSSCYDTDKNGRLSYEERIRATEIIYKSGKDFTNFQGIEYLFNLEYVNIFGCELTSVDFSKNNRLTYVDLGKNQLTSVILGSQPQLNYLSIYENRVTALDVSGCPNLQKLGAEGNRLTVLDLTGLRKMTSLTASNNMLSSVILGSKSYMTTLEVGNNQLTQLDISGCPSLKRLIVNDNQLSELDVTGCASLTALNIQNNRISQLDVCGCRKLSWLWVSKNRLTSLNLTQNSSLTNLDHSANRYEVDLQGSSTLDLSTLPGSFDVSKASNWTGGTVSGTILTVDADATEVTYDYRASSQYTISFALDITGRIPEDLLPIDEAHFPEYGFRQFISDDYDLDKDGYLSYLELAGVTQIGIRLNNVSRCTFQGIEYFFNLEQLNIGGNPVYELDLSQNPKLSEVSIFNTGISSLDLSNNPLVTYLACWDAPLTELILPENSMLLDISLSGTDLTSLDLSACPQLQILDISETAIPYLDLTVCPNLTQLSCENGSLETLLLGENPSLWYINAQHNQLRTLDVSGCSNLQRLFLSFNQLESLELDNNPYLVYLSVSNNRLSSLNLGSKSYLSSLEAAANCYELTLPSSRVLELSSLPGSFDVSKILSIQGATVSADTLIIEEGVYQITYCYDCGCGYSVDFMLDMGNCTDHAFGPWITSILPSCTAPGSEQRRCSVCGYIESRELPAEEHTYQEEVIPPTCTEFGYTIHSCHCGAAYIDTHTDPTGHTYEEVYTPPTCTQEGDLLYVCHCGESYLGTYIAATGHKSVTDPAVAPSCTETGLTAGTHCETCGGILTAQQTVPATGHSYGDWQITAAAACEAQGTQRRDCLACDAYETQTIAALGHSYTSVVTAPTCTEKGYTTHTCIRCASTYTDTYVDALGHSWNSGVVTLEPTDNAEGERTYTCILCGTTRVESIPKLNHVHVFNPVITRPTCTQEGYTTFLCSCGESYTANFTEPLGHDFGEWVRTKEPNYLEYGENTRYCSRCPETQTEPVNNNPFEDVGDSSRFKTAILWAYYTGVTRGTDATHFAPTAIVNRQQFVMFLWQAAGSPEPETGENPFTDVSPNNRFYKAILWASQNGITTGTGDGTTFSPTANCTRGQVVMFLYRYAGKPEIEKEVENPFTDVSVNNNFYKAILWAYSNNITSGKTATTFEIRSDCQRQHVVTFLYRYLEENK